MSMTLTAVTETMMANTPMTMPRRVNAVRVLLLRIVPIAMRSASSIAI